MIEWYNHEILFGTVTAILSVILFYKYFNRKKTNLPPGPKGWPLIGNITDLTSNLVENMNKFKNEYGNVFTIYTFRDPVVVLSDVKAVTEAFVDKANQYAGRPSSYSVDLFGGSKSIAFGDFGEVWKMQRKLAHSAVREHSSGKQLENLMHESFDRMCGVLEEKKGPINPADLMNLLIYNIVAVITLGKRWEFDDPDFKKLIQTIDDANASFGVGLLGDFIPLFQYIPTPGSIKLKKLIKPVLGLLETTMQEHKDTFDPDNIRDLTDSLIVQEIEARSDTANHVIKQLDGEHFIQILSDVFFAGTDTTRYTLLWILLYMAKNPNYQKALQDDIDNVVGKEHITLADKANLHYSNAVLHETLRIAPVGAFTLPHKTTCDTTIGQYDIPKGTQVWMYIYSINNDKNCWRNPTVFDPTRFLNSDGTFAGFPPSFKTFGAGRRICLGEALAKTELLMLTSMIFQKFTVSIPEGESPSDKYGADSFLAIPEPYNVIFTKRS